MRVHLELFSCITDQFTNKLFRVRRSLKVVSYKRNCVFINMSLLEYIRSLVALQEKLGRKDKAYCNDLLSLYIVVL